MNQSFRCAAIAALVALATMGAAQAQMGTPLPPGPPSAQPAKRSPALAPSVSRAASAAGPQIVVPLRRQDPLAEPVAEATSAPVVPATRADALQKCRFEPGKQARQACRDQVKRDFPSVTQP